MVDMTLTQPPVDDTISHPKLLTLVMKGTPIATAGLVAAGCLYVGLNNPETHHILPVCGFYRLTGYYCPGCGMTRALHSLLHGDVLRAFQFNAVLVLVVPVLAYMFIWWTTWAFTARELPTIKISRRVTWGLIALVVVFVVGRNFPGPVAEFFARGRV